MTARAEINICICGSHLATAQSNLILNKARTFGFHAPIFIIVLLRSLSLASNFLLSVVFCVRLLHLVTKRE